MGSLITTVSTALSRTNGPTCLLVTVLLAFASGALIRTAVAQEVTPLFADDTPIEFTLAVPVRTLVTRASRRPEVEGYLEYTSADGQVVRLDAEVRTRGKSRLEICSFPPLSINLRRGQVPDTLFAGQNRIKLVTLCKDNDRYEQYLLREQLAYTIYEKVSDYAYRTRFATVTYIDTSRDDRMTVAPAFFIEHVDSLAERTGMRTAELPAVELAMHDPAVNSIFTVYQYLIGNLDWSNLSAAEGEECCHNTDLLMAREQDTPLIPVPYDFDMSGLLDTDYAEPNPMFNIRSVRQRVYRGFCSQNELLEETTKRFLEARGDIEAAVRDSQLDDENKEDVIEYLASGFEVIGSAEQLQEELIGECRG